MTNDWWRRRASLRERIGEAWAHFRFGIHSRIPWHCVLEFSLRDAFRTADSLVFDPELARQLGVPVSRPPVQVADYRLCAMCLWLYRRGLHRPRKIHECDETCPRFIAPDDDDADENIDEQ